MGNAWIDHMKVVRKQNPQIKDVAKLAKIGKASYKKK